VKITLTCIRCKKQFKLGKYRYNYRIKRNPNYQPFCSRKCLPEFIPKNANERYCPKCKQVKPKIDFYQDKGRTDKITVYCKPCHLKVGKNAREKNPEYRSIYHKRTRAERKAKLMSLLGGAFCKKCGFTDIRALQYDHILGNGRKDKLKFKNHMDTFTTYYITHPEEAKKGLQILCANCNWIKRAENKEYI